MKIYNSISSYKAKAKTVLTLGTFDGVHLGHQKVIQRLVNSAKHNEANSVVLTFFPHPRMVLQQDTDIKLLNTIEEKATLLEKQGLDDLIVHPFDKEFSRLSAEEFVKDILVDKLNICKIIIGYDHRFGRNRTATIDDLIEFGEKYNFEVEQITAKEIDDIAISSTKIRKALQEGEITLANSFLNYNYTLTGKVIKGKQIGRTIGFPTANLEVDKPYKLIPKSGVYIVSSTIDNKIVFGMMNIGTNPTFSGTNQNLEVHFFNCEKDLYETNLNIVFYERIRDEIKFENISKLQIQLKEDQKFSLEYIKKHLQ